ncbi:uncharacterized protein TM35_000152140 [Trypanosoma theileri]|uniref:Uncharacterized protein n=1 Tax=Trypanosoma theileri TaxID=67003 RepID=A0A1X0NWC8_9TRYP|nr:uncharacterized protein TM35_000152140 [Trypanosoma theileri]ORC88783.1 hypothetical protein TM35_000152140 [Trypanosoma theileri]
MSMISRKGLAIAAVTLLALFVVVMPSPVSARDSLECEKVWTGPSSTNDVFACLSDVNRIKAQWRYYVFPAISALLFLVILITFPIVFLCVCCCRCCSCCKRRDAHVTANSRCFLWMWIAYAILWCCGMGILVIYGAQLVAIALPAVFDDTMDGPLKYFNYTADKLIDFTSNWSTGERKPLAGIDLDTEVFANISNTVADYLTDIRDMISGYLKWVPIVSYCIGGVGVVLMFLMIFLACCRCCVPCLPMGLSCVYWIFGVVYSLLGFAAILLAYVATVGCGEIELQYNREPGVLQWFLVPYCQETFDFSTINTAVRDAEKLLSEQSCNALLHLCDDSPSPLTRPLTCGKGITSPNDCPDIGTMAAVLEDTYVKAGTTACPDKDKPCSLIECAVNCTIEEVRTIASGLLSFATVASNASIAVSYARPLLECNFVVDRLLSAMDSCNDLKIGSLMLGTGFFLGGLMFGLAIYIMFRGSCVWRKPKGAK